MLKLKQGICIDCPPGSSPKFLTAGRCQTHYWQHRRLIAASKKRQSETISQSKEALGIWFDYHNRNNNWICENCGTVLSPYSPKAASSCQAHILPKSKFKSVQSVLENHMTLGDPVFQNCGCHDDYDATWERAEGMKVFTLAKERFLTFKHLIDKSELKSLPDPFKKLMYAH